MNWHQNIKVLREKTGLTQRDLAEKVGRTESYISQLEKGRFGPPKPGVQEKFAAAFNLTLDQFLIYIHSKDNGISYMSGVIHVPLRGMVENMKYKEIDTIDTVDVPSVLVKNFSGSGENMIAVEVKDDTFVNDGIKAGTFLIVHVTSELIDGATYIVQVGQTIMVRRLVKNNSGFFLTSPNGKYALFNDKNVIIMGRVLCSQNIQMFI